MAISRENLMRDSQDWGWVEKYEASMGLDALVKYARKLFTYLSELPDNSEVNIDQIVRKENADLFVKCVCRFNYEGRLNLRFTPDFKKLKKIEL